MQLDNSWQMTAFARGRYSKPVKRTMMWQMPVRGLVSDTTVKFTSMPGLPALMRAYYRRMAASVWGPPVGHGCSSKDLMAFWWRVEWKKLMVQLCSSSCGIVSSSTTLALGRYQSPRGVSNMDIYSNNNRTNEYITL